MLDESDINLRLIVAVGNGNVKEARKLIDSYGLSYSKAWSDGYVLLRDATKKSDVAMAELLLTCGSKVNSKHYKPTDTPLHFAAQGGNVNIVKMLLNKGAKVNLRNEHGRTPLFNVIDNISYGCKEDKLEVAQLLLNHGADINTPDILGKYPLHVAVESRCLKIVELLLAYGHSVNCAMYSAKQCSTPLHSAVKFDLKEVVTLLLSRDANVNAKDIDGITPLHIAAMNGYVHIAEDLLNHGACADSLTLKEGCTPLHFASKEGNEETVKFLLNKGADFNASSKDNLTPLHIATKRRNETIIKLLLQHGAKVDNQDKDSKTILHLAVETGRLKIVEDVLKYCPDINNESNINSLKVAVCGNGEEKIVEALLEYGLNIKPEDINNPELLYAAVKKGYLKIVEDLLKYGADVNTLHNSKSEEGFTPLHNAVKNKKEEIAKLLINYEADINAQDKTGKTPIFYSIQNADLKITKLLLANKATVKDNPELLNMAVKKECIKIIEALLQHDVDINSSDKDGRTALHFTALDGYEGIFIDDTELALRNLRQNRHFLTDNSLDIKGEVAKLLLSKGANVNSQTKNGITTLSAAIQKEFAKVVEALLEYNANLNSEVNNVMPPLHLAVQRGNKEIITMLLNKKADVNAKRKDGMTPLHIAVEQGLNEVVKILLEYGAKVDSKIEGGLTPLHFAAKQGYHKIIETLLKFGADINSRNEYGKTALHIAVESRRAEVVATLLEHDSDINIVCGNNCTPLDYVKSEAYTFYYRYRDNNTIIVALKHQIVKMKTINLCLNEKNLLAISTSDEVNDFQNKCEEEIANMKSEKISNGKISFYDILARDKSSLSKYMRNENIIKVLKSDDYKSKFPIYANMIKSHFRKIMERKELLEDVNEIFYFLFNSFPELPDNCAENIFRYLSDEDLKNIMDAYKLAYYQ